MVVRVVILRVSHEVKEKEKQIRVNLVGPSFGVICSKSLIWPLSLSFKKLKFEIPINIDDWVIDTDNITHL